MSRASLLQFASWCAYANGVLAVVGFAAIAAFFVADGQFHLWSDLAFFFSAVALVPIPWVLNQLGHAHAARLSVLGVSLGALGTLASVAIQASVLLGTTTLEQGSAPITIAFGAIGVWMVISNHLGRVDGTLSGGLAWLGVAAGVGLVLAAIILGLQGFRTSDPAALPQSDQVTAAGLVVSVVAHAASLTWAIWLGRLLGGVSRAIPRVARAKARA